MRTIWLLTLDGCECCHLICVIDRQSFIQINIAINYNWKLSDSGVTKNIDFLRFWTLQFVKRPLNRAIYLNRLKSNGTSWQKCFVHNVRVRHFIYRHENSMNEILYLFFLFTLDLTLFVSPIWKFQFASHTQTKLVFYENHLIIKLHTALETEKIALFIAKWVAGIQLKNCTNHTQTLKLSKWKEKKRSKVMLTITTINEQSMWSRLLS